MQLGDTSCLPCRCSISCLLPTSALPIYLNDQQATPPLECVTHCVVLQAADQPLEWLRLSALRDYLHWEFADLVGGGVEELPEEAAWGEEPTEIVPPASKKKDAPVFNFERVLDDLVLLTFLVRPSS